MWTMDVYEDKRRDYLTGKNDVNEAWKRAEIRR